MCTNTVVPLHKGGVQYAVSVVVIKPARLYPDTSSSNRPNSIDKQYKYSHNEQDNQRLQGLSYYNEPLMALHIRFHHNARLTSCHTSISQFVLSRNGEKSLNAFWSPNPDPDHLIGGPSHGYIPPRSIPVALWYLV